MQDAEWHGTPLGSSRERKKPRRYSRYFAQMVHISDSNPSTYKEATNRQVLKDEMVEEYKYILKNDFWEVVTNIEGKSIVTSKWIYKIKHAVDGSIHKYK